MTLSVTAVDSVPEPAVRAAVPAESEDVLDTITRAFASDPVVRWVFKDDGLYHHHFPGFSRAFAGRAFACGTAFVRADLAGAALWLPPGELPDEDSMMEVMAEAVPAGRHDEVNAVFEQLELHHPHDAHWYLPLIGVDPARQGEGHGSALLAHALRLCDTAHLPAYLEATCERNVALYLRHGFEPTGTIRVPGAPVITPMLRSAR